MFDPDQKIADWRKRMAAKVVKSPAALDELESHLRDEIESQMRTNPDPASAFAAALQSLGETSVLKGEFDKIDVDKEFQFKKRALIGVTCFYVLFVSSLLLGKVGALSDLTTLQQLSGMGAVAVTAVLLMGGLLIGRFLPVIRSQHLRLGLYLVLAAMIIASQLFFYHLVMTRFEFDPAQLVIAVLWSMSIVSTHATIIVGLEEAVRLKGPLDSDTPNFV